MIENIRNSDQKLEDALMEEKNFGPFVKLSLDELQMEPVDLCEHLDVSVGIVKRWSEGISMPRPFYRTVVISKLATLIIENSTPGDKNT